MTDEGHEQSPEELQAHFGPAGPVQAATAWLEAVLRDRDYRAAWRLSDPLFRQWRAQEWVDANAHHPDLAGRDVQQLVDDLAELDSTSDVWEEFATIEVQQYRSSWQHVNLDTWGWASRPRPFSPDREIVLFIPASGVATQVTHAALVHGLPLVMLHTAEGWLLSGQSEALPPELRQDLP